MTLNVKQAMLRDVGSRDTEFIECIKFIRQKLLDIAGMSSCVGGQLDICVQRPVGRDKNDNGNNLRGNPFYQLICCKDNHANVINKNHHPLKFCATVLIQLITML